MAEEQKEGQEPQEETQEESFDADYVRELRGENAKWRKQVRSLEKQVEDLSGKISKHEDGQKSEVERLAQQVADLQGELTDKDNAIQEKAISTDVKLSASKMGIVDPDAAYRLIDPNEVNYENGEVVGVEKALKNLLKERPYLKGETPQPPTPGAGGTPVKGGPTFESALLDGLNKVRGGR